MPEPKRVLDFEEIASHFGYSLGSAPIAGAAVPVKERKRDGRIVRKADRRLPKRSLHISSRNYQRLIAKIAGKPEERILSYLMLRSLKQARYSDENRGHFALAAQSYTHFTSPIRRYPDLIVHRILKHYLEAKNALLDEQASHQSARRLLVYGAARRRSRTRTCRMEESEVHGGPGWRRVRCSDHQHHEIRILCRTEELFVEGLVPMETLPGDRFRFHEPTRQVIGAHSRRTFSIGDAVRVRLDKADPIERKLNFGIVEPASTRGKKGKGKRRD